MSTFVFLLVTTDIVMSSCNITQSMHQQLKRPMVANGKDKAEKIKYCQLEDKIGMVWGDDYMA